VGLAPEIPLAEYFAGFEASEALFRAVRHAVASIDPDVAVRSTKSQVAFRRRTAFAWAWIPAKYLRGTTTPLVLTVDLPRRDASPRWKEVVEPRPGRFTHHLELSAADDIDDEVLGWLREAWEYAE